MMQIGETVHLNSDTVRLRWREVLDRTFATGQITVVERWHQPVAVIVPIALWEQLRQPAQTEVRRE